MEAFNFVTASLTIPFLELHRSFACESIQFARSTGSRRLMVIVSSDDGSLMHTQKHSKTHLQELICVFLCVKYDFHMPKKNAPKTVAYTLRLTEPDKKWLDATALAHQVDVPTILRWSIEALKQYAEAHGGRLVTPINIKELWQHAQAIKPQPMLRVADEPDDSQESQTTRKDVHFEPDKKARG